MIPAATLAVYHRADAAAEPGLPTTTTTLAGLPARAPFRTYASDAHVSAAFTEAKVERAIRAMRAHAAADADGIAGSH